MKFLKQAYYIGYVIAKLREYVKINIQTSSDSFLLLIYICIFFRSFFKNKKGAGASSHHIFS